MKPELKPIVLCLSGLDPSGGAGIQADIETLASLGCHCAPIITALTIQDSSNVADLVSVDPVLIGRQFETIFADMPISAVKIGLLADAAVVKQIATKLAKHPDIPVILDPVLKASGGTELANQHVIDAVREQLLPETFLITPNANEAQRLCPASDTTNEKTSEQCASYLHSRGCAHVFITGGDSPGKEVTNQLFSAGQSPQSFRWPRLTGNFHGSGCTLAAAISGFIAKGLPVPEALFQAQQYTHEALASAQPLGKGQLIPIRVSTP
ncbi:MAG: bifunctional hydroxymethylpyrimidine kinase/phosphomethylpyrimidine kinase [Pseudomonadales bacterium]|nr:bifunctional hydroxymethylpyrimidine kinase/phosphomethylpyrimidine kinase [Pseudomonadales bacterium]